MLRDSVEAAEALVSVANDRERGHIGAARAWLDGNFERSVKLYGDVLFDWPRDSLALQIAHLGDFYLGRSAMLRDRVARVLPEWNESVPGYGYVLGMHAFGLEETGDYARAEESARRAIGLNPRDPWSAHAVAHVMEMQGRTDEGIDWLVSTSRHWAPDNAFAYHNWWHLALYHLDEGDVQRVLELYDTSIRPTPSGVVLEMIDAVSLLWRLHLLDVDVGDRWNELADHWESICDDVYYAFNDVHAMMAFVGAGRESGQRYLLEAMERRATDDGTNGMMTRHVGLPLCRALSAFGHGAWDSALDGLLMVRPIAQRMGGSHAQRDVVLLTAVEAALRGRRTGAARALIAERLEAKPRSPANRLLHTRATTGAGMALQGAPNGRSMEDRSGSSAGPPPSTFTKCFVL
jgi:tetratricopeptide (TPR) repeat protein